MRILYHHTTLGGGAEGIHIAEMVEAFRRLGHEVHVEAVAGRGKTGSVRKSALTGVRYRLPAAVFEWVQIAYNAVAFVSVARAISRFKPDLIYKRHARFDCGPLMAARWRGVPLVLEVNAAFASPMLGQYEKVALRRLLTAIERWIFRNADVNLAVSTPLQEEIHALEPAARVVVIPNGANPRKFAPSADTTLLRATLKLPAKPVVGFVGTLWHWHGLDLLVDAMTDLRTTGVHLLIVGDGEMRNELERTVVARGLADVVTFAGSVLHSEVAKYICVMDITVLPAEHRAHASPMKILEYMAMARPTVAPRMRNICELLRDGVDGLLFEPNDRASMVAAIATLARDEALRQRLGASARQRVEQHLNWDNNAQRVIEIYRELSGAPRPAVGT